MTPRAERLRLLERDINALARKITRPKTQLGRDLVTIGNALKRVEREIKVANGELPRTRKAIPPMVRYAVYERDGFHCLRCGIGENLSVDHVVPWSLGGKDTFENLQTLCRPCNSVKGNRSKTDYRNSPAPHKVVEGIVHPSRASTTPSPVGRALRPIKW